MSSRACGSTHEGKWSKARGGMLHIASVRGGRCGASHPHQMFMACPWAWLILYFFRPSQHFALGGQVPLASPLSPTNFVMSSQECGEVALVLIGGRGSRPDHLSSGCVAARSLAELVGAVEVLELHPNNGACIRLCVRLGSGLRCAISEVRALRKGHCGSESV